MRRPSTAPTRSATSTPGTTRSPRSRARPSISRRRTASAYGEVMPVTSRQPRVACARPSQWRGQEEQMTKNRDRFGWPLAVAAVFVALGGNATAQSGPPAQPAPAKQGGPRKAVARPDEWPQEILLGDTTVLLDALQVESFAGTKLKARGTVRIQRLEAEPSVANV